MKRALRNGNNLLWNVTHDMCRQSKQISHLEWGQDLQDHTEHYASMVMEESKMTYFSLHPLETVSITCKTGENNKNNCWYGAACVRYQMTLESLNNDTV